MLQKYLHDVLGSVAADHGLAIASLVGARPVITNEFLIALWAVISIDFPNIHNIACINKPVPFFHMATASSPYLYCVVL